MRHLFSILFSFFLSISVFTQIKIDSTLTQLNTSLENAKTDSLKVEAYLELCNYQKRRDYNKVIVYCNKIHQILDAATYNTKIQRAQTYSHSGIYKRRRANYVEALKDYYAAEKIYLRNNDSLRLSTIYHNIAFIYRIQKQHRKSIDLFNKARYINLENKQFRKLANNYSMMSACYKNMGKIDSSFYVIDKAIEYFEIIDYEEGKQQAIANKASLYTILGKYDVALSIYKNYLTYVKSINKQRSIISTQTNIAKVYLQQNNLELALKYINKSLELAIPDGATKILHDAYFTRSSIYKAMKKHALAFEDVLKYTSIEQEINNAKQAQRLKVMEIFNTQEKQRVRDSIIQIQKRRNLLIEAKNDSLTKLLYGSILLIFALLALIISYFSYRRHLRAKRKQKREEERQQQELHNSNNALKEIEKLDEPPNKNNEYIIEKIIAELKEENLAEEKIISLKKEIQSLNKEFLKQLKSKHPVLTKTDLEVCSYIKIGLSRKEVAKIRDTSIEAIKSTRFRLKKKLELSKEIKLDFYIQSIVD